MREKEAFDVVERLKSAPEEHHGTCLFDHLERSECDEKDKEKEKEKSRRKKMNKKLMSSTYWRVSICVYLCMHMYICVDAHVDDAYRTFRKGAEGFSSRYWIEGTDAVSSCAPNDEEN